MLDNRAIVNPPRARTDLKRIVKILPILTALSFGTAYAYLASYWGRVGINIFEYLSVSDILAYCSPILLLILLTLLITSPLFFIFFAKAALGKPPPDAPIHQTERKRGRTIWLEGVLLLLLTTALVLVSHFYGLHDWPTAVFIGAGALVGAVALVAHHFMRATSLELRLAIILCSVALPLAVLKGEKQYEMVTTSNDGFEYISSLALVDQTQFPKPVELRYLGKAGEYFFFLSDDRKSVLFT